MISTMRPDILAFESPILLPRQKGRGTDEQQVRRLVSVVGEAEKIAYKRKIECYEIHNQTSKSFMGIPGRRPEGMTQGQYKDLMVIEMARRGFSCGDNHQADAAAIALVVFDMLEPS